MDVLKVIGLISAVAVLMVLYYAVEAHCVERFGEKPLNRGVVTALSIAGWCAYIGIAWHSTLVARSADPLNGAMLSAFGVVIGIGVIVRNFVVLRVWLGLFASAVQFVFLPVAMFMPFFYVLRRLFLGFVMSQSGRVREVHHFRTIRHD